jgi:hypothetical protein
MAQFLRFGGSNGIPELDFGLPGATLAAGWPATGAYATAELGATDIVVPRDEQAMPQSNFVATQSGGFHGKTIPVTGVITAVSHATINTILNDINGRVYDPLLSIPTLLFNDHTSQQWDEVVLRNFRTPSRREVNALGQVVQDYTWEFHVLRRGGSP